MMRYARAAIAAAYLSVVAAPIVPVMFLALAVAPIVDVGIVHAVAFAADSAPETVAQATSEANKVVWAWGATVSEIAGAVAWVLMSLAMVALRKLPANLVAIFGNARVELLIDNAINYGLNAVAGAVKDKKLEVDVGNQVLREALQYAIDNAPGWLQSWAGGPEQIAKKIWAKLNLGEGADAAVLPAVVDSVKSS